MKFLSFGIGLLLLQASHAFAPSSNVAKLSPTQNNLPKATGARVTLAPQQMSSSPFDFLGSLFPQQSKEPAEPEKPKIPDVVVSSDFTLSYVFGAIGLFIILTSPSGTFPGPPTVIGTIQGGLNILFASFLAVQAQRIRFVFDEKAFELKNVDVGSSEEDVLKASGENFVVGGANRWDYDSFVNWDFFPSADYPILVYFKETETSEDKWNEGPGGLDKSGIGGQIHFFPAIANVKQLKEQFELRGCASIEN